MESVPVSYGKTRAVKAADGKAMEERLKVGVITSPHGIRGEVKVYPTTDEPKRFKRLKQVLLDTGGEMTAVEIEGVKFFKNMVILKLKGLDTPEEAAKYRRKELYVERRDAVTLRKDEYFIADLIGLQVEDEEGSVLGTLTDVIVTGANDVYVVTLSEGSPYGEAGREVLLPAIKQCVRQVLPEEEKMVVHVMEGLIQP